MDSYQAVYDAACLQLGGFSFIPQHIQQEVYVVSEAMTRPSVLYRPTLSADGSMWCVLLGEDLQSGVSGFGETPAAAMTAFDRAFLNERTPAARRAVALTELAEIDADQIGTETDNAR